MRMRGLITVGATAIALMMATACQPASTSPSPGEPGSDALDIVRAWTEARNDGEIERAMDLLSPTAHVLGLSMATPELRAGLARGFAAQHVGGWRIQDSGCVADGELVTCQYIQDDTVLRRWGLSFTGTHEYTVLDGEIVSLTRVHDPESADRVYAALRAFKEWVRDAHPNLVWVIWSDATYSTYATPEGARAMLRIVDEYQPASPTSTPTPST
jgi:hypothetical protein